MKSAHTHAHIHTHTSIYTCIYVSVYFSWIYPCNCLSRWSSSVIRGSKQIIGLWKFQFYVQSTSMSSSDRKKNNWQLDLAGVSDDRMCLYLSNIAGVASPPIKSSYICCAACKNIIQTHIYLKISSFAHQCCGITSWSNSIPNTLNWIVLRVIPSLHVCLIPFRCIIVIITCRLTEKRCYILRATRLTSFFACVATETELNL